MPDDGDEPPQTPAFGEALRKLRAERNIPLGRLAQMVHYSKGHISRVENGKKNPTPDLARHCEEALDAHGLLQPLVLPSPREAEDQPPETDGPCPYPGLAAFRDSDSLWFFGRRRAIAELLNLIGETSEPVLVVGTSGAGKTSLLHAGLVPAARRGDLCAPGEPPMTVIRLTPTTTPRAELHAHCDQADTPTGSTQLLVVDQFEELFTLCTDPTERTDFINELCALAAAGTRVVLGVRADCYALCLNHPPLRRAAQHGQLALGAMTEEELREAITGPARAAGLELEPGLVDRLLADLGAPHGNGDPGALPLLAHTLRAVWQQRTGRTLTLSGYELIGGVHGSIAASAERAWTRLAHDPGTQRQGRQILLRLVHVGEDTDDFRRRVLRQQLLASAPDADAALQLLENFAAARLVTLGRDTVEITHEALLRAWPRLRGWLDEDRAGLRIHQQLVNDAATWSANDQDPSLLYRGTRLAVTSEWAEEHGDRMGLAPACTDFLRAGQAMQQATAQAERRTARRLRQLVAALSALLLVALVASTGFFVQLRRADAERQAAVSAELAARSAALADRQPAASALLALTAFNLAPTSQARSALLSTQAQYYAGHSDYPGAAFGLAFSPTQPLVAVTGTADGVRVYDARTHREMPGFDGPTGTQFGLAFSHDGRTVATAGGDGTVRLWDVAGRRRRDVLRADGKQKRIRRLAFSPDDTTLAAVGDGQDVALWKPATGSRRTLSGHGGRQVNGVAFSRTGLLATAGDDATIRLWNLKDGSSKVLRGHHSTAERVAFNPQGTVLASTSDDGTVRLWNPDTGECTAVLTGHTGHVYEPAFSPDGTSLAAGSDDNTIRVWDIASRTTTAVLAGHLDAVYALRFSPDGRTLASTGSDHSVIWWNLGQALLATHPSNPQQALAYAPHSHTLATAGVDGTIRLWDTDSGRLRRTLSGHDGRVNGLAISPDGKLLASAGEDKTVRLWRLKDGAPLPPLPGHTDPVRTVAISPNGRLLASAGDDNTIRMWQLPNARPLPALTAHTTTVRALAFSPDNSTLVSGDNYSTVYVWDLKTRHHRQLTGTRREVLTLAFTRDGHILAAAGNSAQVTLWETRHYHLIRTLPRQSNTIHAITFSPDGSVVVAADEDGTIEIRDTRSGTLVATLSGHTGSVNASAYDPAEAHTLATASSDGTARIWRLDPEHVINQDCPLITSLLNRDTWQQLVPEIPFRRICGHQHPD
ncbi:helix-turn-helix domain-containing protein [Streptomyces sp. NPDC020192]|uniref:nSTAND1 domain-containing NTPase n=1 Tax=Streptomyces sp. NPDC020192 TaxID=3365066 RepID=UPI00379A16BB